MTTAPTSQSPDFGTRRPRSAPPDAAPVPARSLGERIADRIALLGGSWTFILCFLAALVVWTIGNTVVLGPRRAAFDPYPYVFLNLILSMLAALQAPVIMMAQNRAADRDRQSAARDHRVNVRSEHEVRRLDEKLDALRDAQWAELVRMQREQISLLAQLVAVHQADRPATPATTPTPDHDGLSGSFRW